MSNTRKENKLEVSIFVVSSKAPDCYREARVAFLK